MTEIIDATIIVNDGNQVTQSVMYFPVGNDITVTVQYPNISDGTGYQTEFYYKDDRTTPDDDPASIAYAVALVADPVNVGATMSTIQIPSTDNDLPGAYWWRVDLLDPEDLRTTIGFGTLLVEAV